jgi:hypothetical protein
LEKYINDPSIAIHPRVKKALAHPKKVIISYGSGGGELARKLSQQDSVV